MAILFSKEFMDAIMHELNNASESVQIITAYCKKNTIKYLSENIAPSVSNKRLMVRFRLDDLVKGSTDFDILEYCQKTGWEVYIRFDLHAKTYIVDNRRGFVGSANATNSGLSIGRPGNIEMGTLVDIDSQDIEKVNVLFRDAILVDDVVLAKLRKQYSLVDKTEVFKTKVWDNEIVSLFQPHIESLFSYELPDCDEIIKGTYISFLDVDFDGDLDKLKETFRWSNAYIWLLNTLKDNGSVMYFGELSSKLHSVLITDPKPYRKDVKFWLGNLLDIIKQLDMEEVVIDRPNYSQRVRLVMQ
ncbi:MAG: hypothetical protein J1E98_11255 [Lachnospiraceae bacterium]|nr:hypothetical protein [Lachnospiraceae bacterium]